MKKTKAKKDKAPLIPETPKVELIPQDLQDRWGAVLACSTAFTVLDKGYFPHTFAATVKQSLQFLAKLHEQTVEAALEHPQYHMIPELKKLKEDNKNVAQEQRN